MYEDVIILAMDEHRKRVRVFLATEPDGHIIAWSCLLLPPDDDSCLYAIPKKTKYTPIYTYVARLHRGKKLGKRLLKQAANYAISQRFKPTVFFWNDNSEAFFDSVGKEIHKLCAFDVYYWDEIYE